MRTALGQAIPPLGQIIGDAAPTGEVFVARSDKTFMFYEPLRGSGMPAQIALPSNMVLLLGAIWN